MCSEQFKNGLDVFIGSKQSTIGDLNSAEGAFFLAQAIVGLNALAAEAVQTLENYGLLH